MTELPPPERAKRVVIVDDSRTIRAMIRAAVEADARLEVVGEAGDPYDARDVIKATNPDVISLDVEMPRMNGLVFLEHLMRLRPMPVIMVSSRTKHNSVDAIRALSLGAVDCVDVARFQADPNTRKRLADTLFLAAGASVRRAATAPAAPVAPSAIRYRWNGRYVVIGSSTGGVDALERVLAGFPEDGPPVLIAQHMPAGFLTSFAARLDTLIAPRVTIAEDGQPIEQGTVLFAPGGDWHLTIGTRAGAVVRLQHSTGRELYVPEVDTLFRSAAALGRKALGVVLTGMGRDGAEGLLAMREAGAHTIAQSGETSLIDGMPRAARENGAAMEVVDLERIGAAILAACAIRMEASA